MVKSSEINELSKDETELLLKLIGDTPFDSIDWNSLARSFRDKKGPQLKARYMQIMPQFAAGPWTKEEDLAVLIGHRVFGRDWIKIQNIKSVNRNGVQIRERVDFVLSRQFKKGAWNERDDPELLYLYKQLKARHENKECKALWSELGRRLKRRPK